MGYISKVGDRIESSSHTYTIVKEINKGGFADAYKAIDESKNVVFLKQYKSPSKLVSWFKPYFKYEAELNSRLKNDPVLQNATVYANEVFLSKVYKENGDLWTRNECLFQVFPFISGNTNLNDMIQKGFKEFDWEKRLYACTVFAFALRKLHDADVIHCDLKPENVQVKLDNSIAIKYRPLLVDMDWSILSDKKAPWHGQQGYVGTVGYNSPEHLNNKAPLEASDVFTAAIIICEVMANAHPFASHLGEDDFNKYVLSGKCDFEDPSKIPFVGEVTDKFRELIFKSLNIDPKKRPTMTDIHLELMAMCKSHSKPKAPSIIDSIKTKFSSSSTKKEAVVEPIAISKPSHKPYKDASMVESGKGCTTMPITLFGDCGTFSTKIGFVIDMNTLKRVTTNAKYADHVEQFSLNVNGSHWEMKINPDAANITCVNGKEVDKETIILNNDDTIQLKGRSSGKIIDLAKVVLI